ncbi:nucleotidyltransferase family protein [Hyphococcus flavus]|uniref:Nucleotidyltransferase family protein n=1 Tax=Hyphococcus flavus TaxID=1866326 RepID=A0AAE9ZHE0_9PROT|nr:nucleotidyltransferase family protein [Hyphococcus flavus]WDI32587.1 nucleotidyltransferase family protein [Hyphococcus flavus]
MTKTPQTAMVLAAGLGTRMRPLTDETPKPLIKVAGKPLIDYALDRFKRAGVGRVIVNVHHLADQVEAHMSNVSGLDVVISDERGALLETGGGLKKARPQFADSPVFCTNTDAIMIDGAGEEACAALANAWDGSRMDALLLLVPIERTSGYEGRGDFERGDDGKIALRSGETAPFVFTGLQIISPRLIDEGPDGAFSTRVLWDKAAANNRLLGVVYDGEWLHVGDPPGLEAAEKRLRDGVVSVSG